MIIRTDGAYDYCLGCKNFKSREVDAGEWGMATVYQCCKDLEPKKIEDDEGNEYWGCEEWRKSK